MTATGLPVRGGRRSAWPRGRRLLALGAVATVLVTNLAAALAGPANVRTLLYVCGVVATGIAVLAVTASGTAVAGALGLSLPAVLALLATDAGPWLIGPLASLLLLAGELAAWSWEYAGVVPAEPAVMHQRGLDTVRLAGLGLVAAVAVSAVGVGRLPGGSAAVVVAAVAAALLARVTFAARR